MGHLNESHGLITVESRRESFIVHAGYGYGPARAQVRNLPPGAFYRALMGDTPMQVVGQMIDCTLVRPAGTEGDSERVPLDYHVIPVGSGPAFEPLDQDFDDTAPLARVWSQNAHPEFEYKDLADLIEALIEEADRKGVALKRMVGVAR